MAIHTTQSSPSIEASQPSSLPTPPTILKAETYTWILRPPPFPPPCSSSNEASVSTSVDIIEQCTRSFDSELLNELEDIVLNSTSISNNITSDNNTNKNNNNNITTTTTTTNIDFIPSFLDDDFNDTNNNNSSSNNNMTSLRHPSFIDDDLDFNDFIIYDSNSISPPASVDLFPPFPS